MSKAWQPVLDALGEIAAVIDGEGRLVAVSARWRESAVAGGADPSAVLPPASYLGACASDPQVSDGLRTVLAGADRFTWDYLCPTPERSQWFRMVANGLDHDGARYALVVHHDTSEAESRFRHLSELSETALLELDLRGRARFASTTWLRMRGRRHQREELGTRWIDGIDPVDRAVFEPLLHRCLAEQAPLDEEVRLVGNSRLRWVRVRGHGTPSGYVLAISDVTADRDDHARLEHAARHDYLTGLPNRAAFIEAVDGRRAGRNALMFLDLDDFKAVNDTAGHSAGDAILRSVAGRLRRTLRPGDLAARFAGDEFVVQVLDVTGPEDAGAAAARLIRALAHPYAVAGRQHTVTATIGVVMDEGTTDAGTLLDAGDAAMLGAKAAGKNRWALSNPGQGTAAGPDAQESSHAPTCHTGHLVTTYRHDAELLGQVRDFVSASLGDGAGALVVATPEHRAGLLEELRSTGVDVEAVTASGQLLCLDAEWTLGRFLLDGTPSLEGFTTVVGSLVHDMVVRWPRVSIYGEMVALLWSAGDVVAALTLEDMWNDLGRELPFTLLCGYPLGDHGQAELDAVLARHDPPAAA